MLITESQNAVRQCVDKSVRFWGLRPDGGQIYERVSDVISPVSRSWRHKILKINWADYVPVGMKDSPCCFTARIRYETRDCEKLERLYCVVLS